VALSGLRWKRKGRGKAKEVATYGKISPSAEADVEIKADAVLGEGDPSRGVD